MQRRFLALHLSSGPALGKALMFSFCLMVAVRNLSDKNVRRGDLLYRLNHNTAVYPSRWRLNKGWGYVRLAQVLPTQQITVTGALFGFSDKSLAYFCLITVHHKPGPRYILYLTLSPAVNRDRSLKNEGPVIIYSTSCHSKPMCWYFFYGMQK